MLARSRPPLRGQNSTFGDPPESNVRPTPLRIIGRVAVEPTTSIRRGTGGLAVRITGDLAALLKDPPCPPREDQVRAPATPPGGRDVERFLRDASIRACGRAPDPAGIACPPREGIQNMDVKRNSPGFGMNPPQRATWRILAAVGLTLAAAGAYGVWAWGMGTECRTSMDATGNPAPLDCSSRREGWVVPVQWIASGGAIGGVASLLISFTPSKSEGSTSRLQ